MSITSAETTTIARPARPARAATRGGGGSALAVVAGIALLAGPALFVAGLASSPAETGDDKMSYLASLARNPLQTQVSAVLLHYGNLLMGAGLLVLPWLVRGRRGARLTLIGALVAALLQLNLSGALFTDWFHMELARQLPLDRAAAISDQVLAYPLQQLCFGLSPLIAAGLIMAYVGLARAGVVGWWSIPAIVAGYAGMLFLPYSIPILPALGVLPLMVVLGVTGWRVLGRVRADRRPTAH